MKHIKEDLQSIRKTAEELMMVSYTGSFDHDYDLSWKLLFKKIDLLEKTFDAMQK